ncbi:MAG: chemotaxis protein CheW [Clostridia bacterium]|jgi:purine-binding chemotaxis protein CheW|nr:chemotaxis protein CheW [Clostridia bacterium]
MAVEQAVVFKLGVEEYALSVAEVKEIINYGGLTKIPNAPQYMEGIINLRGKIIPVINVAAKFGLPFIPGDNTKTIIVETAESDIGIMVSEVSEVLNIDQTNIEKNPVIARTNAAIAGIAKINTRLIILLNLAEIFSRQELQEFDEIS